MRVRHKKDHSIEQNASETTPDGEVAPESDDGPHDQRGPFATRVSRFFAKFLPGPISTFWDYKTAATGIEPAECTTESYCDGNDHAMRSLAHMMTVTLPQQPPPEGGYPAIILLHGGGFISGTKDDPHAQVIAKEMSEKYGYAVFSLNYHRIQDAPKGEMLDMAVNDVSVAFNTIKANAATYGVNPDMISLFGVSAGGFISMSAAAFAGVGVEKIVLAYAPTEMREFKGVGASYLRGQLLSKRKFPELSLDLTTPEHQFAGAVLLIYGALDDTVPMSQAQDLYQTRCSQNLPTEFIVVQGQEHGFLNTDDVTSQHVLFEVDAFLRGTSAGCEESTIAGPQESPVAPPTPETPSS